MRQKGAASVEADTVYLDGAIEILISRKYKSDVLILDKSES